MPARPQSHCPQSFSNDETAPGLILASLSGVRAMLLRHAGLVFEVRDSRVDEELIKQEFGSGNPDTDALALRLAGAKAASVAGVETASLVIGADQILSCAGRRYDKPRDMAEARANLCEFRNKTHCLHSAVVLMRGTERVWSHVACAYLTMRDFSDAFLDSYLAILGEKVRTSVGCYHLEGPGIQLFEKIEGDYFTILGMPLLPLLAELRRQTVVPS